MCRLETLIYHGSGLQLSNAQHKCCAAAWSSMRETGQQKASQQPNVTPIGAGRLRPLLLSSEMLKMTDCSIWSNGRYVQSSLPTRAAHKHGKQAPACIACFAVQFCLPEAHIAQNAQHSHCRTCFTSFSDIRSSLPSTAQKLLDSPL